MNKKIILLALAAVSAAAFVLPATAMAVEEDVPLHVVPKPVAATPVGSTLLTTWSAASGITFECKKGVTGSATWESSTTGQINLTFNECFFGTFKCEGTSPVEAAPNIKTTELPFHLVTAEHPTTHAKVPAVLITPGAGGHFATFKCGSFPFKVTGTGIIGRIESPACGNSSKTMNIVFEITKHGEQTYRTVVGTPATEYDLLVNNETAALTGTTTITFAQETKLECT